MSGQQQQQQSGGRFRKHRLISEDDYQRLKQQRLLKEYDPRLAGMLEAEQERRAIPLTDESVPLRERLLRHLHTLDRYRDLRGQLTTTTTPTPTPAPPAAPAAAAAPQSTPTPVAAEPIAADVEGSIDPSGIIERLGAKQKEHASALVSYILSRPDVIRVHPNLEISINGQQLPDSNLSDLVFTLYSGQKRIHDNPPPHLNAFASALSSIHVPHKFLTGYGKALIYSLADIGKMEGKGLSVRSSSLIAPPGIRRRHAPPHVLRVYRDV